MPQTLRSVLGLFQFLRRALELPLVLRKPPEHHLLVWDAAFGCREQLTWEQSLLPGPAMTVPPA